MAAVLLLLLVGRRRRAVALLLVVAVAVLAAAVVVVARHGAGEGLQVVQDELRTTQKTGRQPGLIGELQVTCKKDQARRGERESASGAR